METGISQSKVFPKKKITLLTEQLGEYMPLEKLKKVGIIKRTDFKVVRPKTSISPSQINFIIGKKCNRDITKNQTLELSHFN